MRGRKPIPPVLKLLTGNASKTGTPKALRDQVKATLAAGGYKESSVGPPPDGYPEAPRAIWERVAKEAVWLDASNRELLDAYCRASAMLSAARGFRTAALLVRSLAAELGLSATARARLPMQGAPVKRASDLPPELAHAAAKPDGA